MRRSSVDLVRRRRDKLREQGMRPVQIWVPDTHAPGFAAEVARRCRLITAATSEEDLDFLDHVDDDVLRED